MEGSSGLSERLKSQQTALWELISTELAYIRTLKVIQDVRSSSSSSSSLSSVSVSVVSELSMQPAKQSDPVRDRHGETLLQYPRDLCREQEFLAPPRVPHAAGMGPFKNYVILFWTP